jgi:hypothetical protein
MMSFLVREIGRKKKLSLTSSRVEKKEETSLRQTRIKEKGEGNGKRQRREREKKLEVFLSRSV